MGMNPGGHTPTAEHPGAGPINYDDRRFRSSAAETAGANGDTPVGHYHQDGSIVWGEFSGGAVLRGSMAGRCTPDGCLEFAYCQLLDDDSVVGGRCVSRPILLPDGRIRLTEHWQRYGEHPDAGVSCIEEVVDDEDEAASRAYAANSARFFAGMASLVGGGTPSDDSDLSASDVVGHSSFGIVLRRPLRSDPGGLTDLIERYRGRRRVIVEDAFDVLPLPEESDCLTLHPPLMVRQPGPVEPTSPAGVEVCAVTGSDQLAAAERCIVDGYPLTSVQSKDDGTVLPPAILERPGWTVWLARRGGTPAGGLISVRTDQSLGLYWLATLPEARSHGVGRALMTRALAIAGDLPTVLAATDDSEKLYLSLGFRRAATATWRVWPLP